MNNIELLQLERKFYEVCPNGKYWKNSDGNWVFVESKSDPDEIIYDYPGGSNLEYFLKEAVMFINEENEHYNDWRDQQFDEFDIDDEDPVMHMNDNYISAQENLYEPGF